MTIRSQTMPARILIVDDHPILRKGIEIMVDAEEDLEICGEASDASSALEVLDTCQPDIAIVDISLQGIDGIELTKRITEKCEVPVLVLSMHDESLYAERAIRAGAHGYIMKGEPPERLLEAIRRVLDGDIYVSDRVANRILSRLIDKRRGPESLSPIDTLTDRELQVLRLLGDGRGTRQIAENLDISVKTVETYRAHLKEKLSLGTANELVRFAVEWVLEDRGRSGRP